MGDKMKYDLNLYSLTYQAGQLQDHVPGFFVWSAPKRAARGRQDDSLILQITMPSGKSFSDEEKNNLLEKITNDFFKSSGSVTTALRMVIDTINLTLLDRNLKMAENSERASADLLLGVIHTDMLFVAQCGVAHGYLINQKGLVHFHDQEVGERGLGLSRMPKIKFFQESIEDDTFFVVSPNPPEAWKSENLVRGGKPNFEQLWRRLHHQMPKDQVAGLIHIKAGSGIVKHIYKNNKNEPIQDLKASTNAQPENEGKDMVVEVTNEGMSTISTDDQPLFIKGDEEEVAKINQIDLGETEQEIVYLQVEEEDILQTEQDIDEKPFDIDAESNLPITSRGSLKEFEGEKIVNEEDKQLTEDDQKENISMHREFSLNKLSKQTLIWLSKALNWTNSTSRKFRSKEKFNDNDFTDQKSGHLSRGLMLLIAIIIPIMVVALAASVYLARGQNKEFQLYLELGQAAAYNAELFSNSVDKRNAWNDAQKYANLALSYKYSDEADALLKQTQSALDDLDGAVRLIYETAFMIDDLASLNISRIIPYAADLYLLDSYAGQVIQLTLGKHGYEISPNFVCTAGTYNGIKVSRLVEVLSVPQTNSFKATIAALDSNGNIIYCANGKEPVAATLVEPETGWGTIKAAAYNPYYDNLLILDPEKNEIWIYRGITSSLGTSPAPYYDEFPRDLSTAIDFDTNVDELYVLYTDGHMSRCISSNMSGIDTKCTDPLVYKDARNNGDGLNFSGRIFTQLSYSGPLDPSIFLLSPDDTAIYQFSLLMNLNRIYRSDYDQQGIYGKAPTAFAISSNRNAFLAFENRLFYAVFP